MPNAKPPPDDPSVWGRIADFYGSLSGWLQALILIGAAAGVLVTFFRWVRPVVRGVFSDARAIRDTLVGRPAMRDSITKRIIPGTAQPSIGERMAATEGLMAKVSETLGQLAGTTSRLDQHEERFTQLGRRLDRVEEALSLDKRLDKIESVQLLRTIETVAQAEAAPPAEGDRPD